MVQFQFRRPEAEPVPSNNTQEPGSFVVPSESEAERDTAWYGRVLLLTHGDLDSNPSSPLLAVYGLHMATNPWLLFLSRGEVYP